MLSKSIKGRICYQDDCPKCDKDLGFRQPVNLGKVCRSCANSIAKLGKSSPKKGTKTGKPAWNRGPNFDNKNRKILSSRISRRMRHSLSRRNLSKQWIHIFDMLGFSVDQLEKHLESKFEPGMTWENIGEWHIDHIKPDSWFNYSSVEDQEFKDCWSLNNLQPMWKLENISKNNRFSGKSKGGG